MKLNLEETLLVFELTANGRHADMVNKRLFRDYSDAIDAVKQVADMNSLKINMLDILHQIILADNEGMLTIINVLKRTVE